MRCACVPPPPSPGWCRPFNKLIAAANNRANGGLILPGTVEGGLMGMSQQEKDHMIGWDTREELREVLQDSEGVEQLGIG